MKTGNSDSNLKRSVTNGIMLRRKQLANKKESRGSFMSYMINQVRNSRSRSKKRSQSALDTNLGTLNQAIKQNVNLLKDNQNGQKSM